MDEIERSLSNAKSDEHEQSGKAFFVENDEVERTTPVKFQDDIAPAASISPLNRSDSKQDTDNDDDDDGDENVTHHDQVTDVIEQFHNVHIPVDRAFPTEIYSQPESSRHDETELNNQQHKEQHTSLSEYLNAHERFLKSIDHNRQLSSYERIQLDRQKEDLKKLREQLAKRLEDNSLKNRYAKQKQDDNLRKRNAYLQRRFEEARLKESRKPRVQTTFRVSDHDKRSKSHMKKKAPITPLFLSPTKSMISSVSNYSMNNHMESQTDANYFDRFDMNHRLDQFDKYYKEHPDQVGQSLRQVITQFVEHSKQSWSHE